MTEAEKRLRDALRESMRINGDAFRDDRPAPPEPKPAEVPGDA